MHRATAILCLLAGALAGGCPLTTAPTAPDSVVAGDVDYGSPGNAPADSAASAGTHEVRGTVNRDEYRLFDLGAGPAGARLKVRSSLSPLQARSFLVVLLNEEYELLQRQLVNAGAPLEHILRADNAAVWLGVAPTYASSGGDFAFSITRVPDVGVPAPQRQVVWLNFAGGAGLHVHARGPLTLAPFDAAMLGTAYEGATELVKSAIVDAVAEDYAGFDVDVLTSDEGVPDGPYTTLHFGGYDGRLLGLADSVDQYNLDPAQHAIIFVESFADYAVMNLTEEEIGQMVGNVASHECGHLLGLFHTRVPTDLMDTTGTAWDLAADQDFLTAELEPSVFPFGSENSPRRLAETVGLRPAAKSANLAKLPGPERMRRKLELRALVRDELRGRCGTCLHLDE